ncbi:SagB/ThcOx family dehydrogenase [bacterium]|nr:SagB/ThcOx family dehydrogenase [bacterium]
MPASKSIGKLFWKETEYGRQVSRPKGPTSLPPLSVPASHVPRIALPRPEAVALEDSDFRRLVVQRRSLRQYADTPYRLEELAWLCFATQGMVNPEERKYRTVPSAGARHAFETYLSVTAVEGVARGVYRYLPGEHALVRYDNIAVSHDAFAPALVAACLDQPFAGEGACCFIWSAVAERMTSRYGDRGYRYLCMDAGHVCQNLYLACESIGAGCCAIAAYDDGACNQLLGLDGENEFVIYLAATGKKR